MSPGARAGIRTFPLHRFGAEGRSLLPSRPRSGPKPYFHDGLPLRPIWLHTSEEGLPLRPRQAGNPAMSVLPLALPHCPHTRSEDQGYAGLYIRARPSPPYRSVPTFPFRFRPFDPIRRRSFPVRQVESDSAARVVQAPARLFFHRVCVSRWTTVDKAVNWRGCAATANDSSRCSEDFSAGQPPRFASSRRRSALSLIKPSASF